MSVEDRLMSFPNVVQFGSRIAVKILV